MTYEYEGKTEKEAIEMAAAELGLERDQFDVEIIESQKTGLFKKGFVKIRVHTVDAVEHGASESDNSAPAKKVNPSCIKLIPGPDDALITL